MRLRSRPQVSCPPGMPPKIPPTLNQIRVSRARVVVTVLYTVFRKNRESSVSCLPKGCHDRQPTPNPHHRCWPCSVLDWEIERVCHISFLDILLEDVVLWDHRLQRPVARSSNIVAQQQRNGAESVDTYSLRLRESSGKARLLQALPSAVVLSQLAFPVQVSFAPLQPSDFCIASGLTPVLMR